VDALDGETDAPQSEVKRTSVLVGKTSVPGSKATFDAEFCCAAQDAVVIFSYGPEFIDRGRSKELGSPGRSNTKLRHRSFD
jgi:hypothetical protein